MTPVSQWNAKMASGGTSPLVLSLEDEPEIAELVEIRLSEEGFRTCIVLDPREALKTALEAMPSLILLDVVMPGLSGIDVCRMLKATPQTRTTPIIFLTGQGGETDIVAGLELGADDYLTKPFSYSVLVARIRAVLRRAAEETEGAEAATILEGASIRVDERAHEVTVDKQPVSLTLAEFHLLATLLRHSGRVLTRKQLLESIADSPGQLIERNVDVHVGTLRKKLGNAGAAIQTVRGVGYKFRDAEG